MAHTIYDNFFLSNEAEDQFNSHLDLTQFCTVDTSLEGVAGMKRIINVYKATNGTEKLGVGQGNSKRIEVSYTPEEYEIQLAQNRFEYFDEQAMKDDMLVPVGVRHAATDMFNTVNADVYAEYLKTEQVVESAVPDFAAFVTAVGELNLENLEGVQIFAFVNPKDMPAVRAALKDDLKYVEAFAKNGYVGTVGGVNVHTKKDATQGTIVIATKEAVTMFVKKGTEVEQTNINNRSSEDANIRKNTVTTRKYYLAALTNATRAVKLVLAGE